MRLTVLAVLVCFILGCQAPPPIAAPPPPATVAPTETVLAAPATAEVWGEVPKQCAWHTEPLARVASDLQDLPVEFQLENAVDGWQLFSVKFDPTQVSADRIGAILKDAGALVIAAPAVGPPWVELVDLPRPPVE